jgi:hypothetical protein
MSVPAIHPYASACPLCGQGNGLSIGRLQGRLVCPYCNSSLVVSETGQFVRDPFGRRRPLLSIQQLRRQSRPIARMFRDVQPTMRVLLGTVALLMVAGAFLQFVESSGNWVQPLPLQSDK